MHRTLAIAFSAAAFVGLSCGSNHAAAPDASASPETDAQTDAPPADAGARPALGQVDRAGRPLIAVLLIPESLEDDYNAASTFDASLSRTLSDALTSRLHALDVTSLGDAGPDPVDWPIEGGAHPLLPMLATDVLLVDPTLPCVSLDGSFAPTYLDIEREIFGSLFPTPLTHTTCGGRTPDDDVVDPMLTLLITRDREGGTVTQGVNGPTKQAPTTFPYLADPN